MFVFVEVGNDETVNSAYEQFAGAGHPVVRIVLSEKEEIGQEFFRWEFATAVAGSVMRINPFDQPDVEAAKVEARKITEEYENTGALPAEEPFFTQNGISLFSGSDYAGRLRNSAAGASLKELLAAHLSTITTGDYFALLAYVQMNEETERRLQAIREAVLKRTGAATCLGFGPRFLHSTGQAYKGGPNNGVFLQITCDDPVDLPVPGQKYTFGVVKAAQARGDFQVLVDRGRRALRCHTSGPVEAALDQLADILR